jgi:uncharacterized protein (TIGR03435 family)
MRPIRRLLALAFLSLLALSADAQPAASTPPAAWAFDVAVLRPEVDTERRTRIFRHAEDTEFIAQNVGFSALIQYAYGVSETRVLGLSGALKSARFNVQAKGDIETDARFRRLTPPQMLEAKRLMMQALLRDRCGLEVHRETREMGVYALVVAKGGSKLQASDETTTQAWAWWNHIGVEGGKTLDRFAEELTRVSGRPVLNRTGLDGQYSLELEWADDDDDDATVPTLFTAIREQLGLTLEPAKAPVEVIVVDHLEMPTSN